MLPPRMGEIVQTPTVLVVDDDASLRLLCRVNLELDGYHVLEAQNVAAAERLILAEPVDVVLLDVHVGPESGIALMRTLRERGIAPPVVLFTGSARLDAETRDEADGVVAKPFRLDELRDVVRRLTAAEPLDSARDERRCRPAPSRLRVAPAALPLRARGGGPRRPRRGEGGLRARRDRRALRRALHA